MSDSVTSIAPYRVLFPVGIAFAGIGVVLWPLYALGFGYPGVAHRELMMLGFELSFVLGFLLTAMPGLTHGEPCRTWELAASLASVVALGAAVLVGQTLVAAIAMLIGIGVVAAALLRRAIGGRSKPPEEFVFVALALAAGVASGALRLADAAGIALPVPFRLSDRLVSLGMVLPLVLGLGTLLVPAFAGMRDPLLIPGIAGAHERPGRRALYALLVVLLAGSFVADLAGRPTLGHVLRAVPAWTLVLLAWRPWRPGRAGASAWALRVAGPLTALGVTLAAALPRYEVAALHVTFIGGFALLTVAVGTRVVVAHGRQPLTLEASLITPEVLAGLTVALILRLLAEARTDLYLPLLVASAAMWIAVWAIWGAAIGRVLLAGDKLVQPQ